MSTVESGQEYTFEHMNADIRIEILNLDDPDLGLWNYKVVEENYPEDKDVKLFYEGRTVACRIKESVLENDDHYTLVTTKN